MIIKLKNILEKEDYPNAGNILFGHIKKAINDNEVLIIDMIDVISIPTMFMNNAFGTVIDEFGVDKLKYFISFKNISKSQAERITKYLSDYTKLISNNEK
jgi:hypothetical protein